MTTADPGSWLAVGIATQGQIGEELTAVEVPFDARQGAVPGAAVGGFVHRTGLPRAGLADPHGRISTSSTGYPPPVTVAGICAFCDLSGQLAGAGATRIFAAFGAQVIRIEDPVARMGTSSASSRR
ncbi:MAG: hypothetical protein R2705_25495 [Ilumatobacteraceae bacterium]